MPIQHILPGADWQSEPELRTLMQVIGAETGHSRYVGGAVRDTLLGLSVKDVDVATQFSPADIVQRLEAAGIKAVPTGIAHGTVTAVLSSRSVEITTLRRDITTDGRHATVAFSTDWQEDAARRDFTFNALYADPLTGAVFDYFDGVADLHAGAVRFIGSPDARITEDYLRILRYFRFFARFGSTTPDAAALDACARHADGLHSISAERIANELLALLATPNPLHAIEAMQVADILRIILPDIAADAIQRLTTLVARETASGVPPHPLTRLAMLIAAGGDAAERTAKRLRLSNNDSNILIKLGNNGKIADVPAPTIGYRHGTDLARQILLLHASDDDLATALAMLSGWTPPPFPLRGQHLIDLGMAAGPAVSKTLRAIEDQWIAEGFPDAERLAGITSGLVKEV